ncbi:MAG: EAL domain-containing protein [Burkholderiaceae bacterium]
MSAQTQNYYSTAGRQLSSMQAAYANDRIRVLAIDDDPLIHALILGILEPYGYEVLLAKDGKAGIQSFIESQPNVILLDVKMPGINGFQTCEAIRKLPQGEHVPIVMVTGDDSPNAVEQAFQSGATDFCSKPLNLDLLLHRIQFVLRAKSTADVLRKRERSLERAQQLAGLGNWQIDIKRDQIHCCDNLKNMLSLDASLLSRDNFLARIDFDDQDRVAQFFIDLTKRADVRPVNFSCSTADGSLKHLSMSADISNVVDQRGNRIVGVVLDNTEQRRTETRIHTLAYYDSVTGLANRLLSNKFLSRSIERFDSTDTCMAVLFVDLDHFKRINDTWGHSTGDEVLRIAADRLKSCLRKDDSTQGRSLSVENTMLAEGCVARVGGDEFVIVASNLKSTNDAAIIARRINSVMSQAFQTQEAEVYIGSSVGISIFPNDAGDAENLLKQADAAMYEAKRSGRNCYRFFTKNIQDRAFEQLESESRLRKAIDAGQFILHYQPKIDVACGNVTGVEALARWQHPERGLVYPDEFIPLAEESGLIVPLGQWVLEMACKQARIINSVLPGDDISMAVNISAMQFGHGNIISMVESALHKAQLAPHLLELELTESNILNDAQTQIEMLHKLKTLGVRLSIDDFGTGYSSLRYLKQFPIDALKVDRCFVQEVNDSPADAAIVKSVINLAHNLHLRVIAEGIETQDQFDFLHDNACDEAQGYLICNPLSISELIIWARARNTSSVDSPVLDSDLAQV